MGSTTEKVFLARIRRPKGEYRARFFSKSVLGLYGLSRSTDVVGYRFPACFSACGHRRWKLASKEVSNGRNPNPEP